MKKTAFILSFLLCCLFAQAQVASYRIDPLQGGGFYLVETVRDTAKGTFSEFPQKFNTKEQLDAYVRYLREQANAARNQAEKGIKDSQAEAKKIMDAAKEAANKLNASAPVIESAATKIEQVGVEFFTPKPEVSPAKPVKPKKRKKQ